MLLVTQEILPSHLCDKFFGYIYEHVHASAIERWCFELSYGKIAHLCINYC